MRSTKRHPQCTDSSGRYSRVEGNSPSATGSSVRHFPPDAPVGFTAPHMDGRAAASEPINSARPESSEGAVGVDTTEVLRGEANAREGRGSDGIHNYIPCKS
ncbi:hypothetical protein MRX96_056466 [Rhipicephalus microplus]